jgi:prepilin peptidase CpaA
VVRVFDAWSASGAVFTGLLALAAYTDLRSRRIPNAAVAALLACGIAQAMVAVGPWPGLLFAIKGMLLGFALWLPLHLAGAVGAGDVKLAAAASSWLGVSGAIHAWVAGALAGGVLAVVVIARLDAWRRTATNLGLIFVSLRAGRLAVPVPTASDRGLPYGVAIAAGALFAMLG